MSRRPVSTAPTAGSVARRTLSATTAATTTAAPASVIAVTGDRNGSVGASGKR